ncbi:PEP-CTERM sorting domain-containing protein [Pseudoduganella sp. SL102]|uniref:PEP-CTERM sorting domain-containing protein n=1 Tax=Pseudoduganella sp. SL102 TaxID=2995154 RepID=UPI00248BBF08|nr:PEP-CTERM sorting domain-containing protein [Pseudoduganella sp. SL102]WBS01302.1 PEP-CTERM sorting domain-containing protein [Pseudoduganella sp. SL102]
MNKLCLALLLAAHAWAGAATPIYKAEFLGAAHAPTDLNNNGAVLNNLYVDGHYTSSLSTRTGVVAIDGFGGPDVYGAAVNDAGVVTGYATHLDGRSHAFVHADGKTRDLGTLGGLSSGASAINNAGAVVGTSRNAAGEARAFLYTPDGGMQDLGTLGGARSEAHGISEAGEVLGTSFTASGEWHTFLYSGGTMIDLDTLYGPGIHGIGPNGELLGNRWEADAAGNLVPRMIIERSTWQPTGDFAIVSSMAEGYMLGRNRDGTVAMLATPEASYALAELAGPGWRIEFAVDVNDAGQVLAWGCNWQLGHGCGNVLLSPVPEPATCGMLAAGLGVVALARRRKGSAVSRSA